MRFTRLCFPALIVAAIVVHGAPPAFASTGALWHMDEAAGTGTMADSVGSNTGTWQNITAGVAGDPGISGSTAYQFNGTSSRVIVAAPASSLDPGATSFKYTAHVKFSVRPPSGDYDIIRKGSPSNTGGFYKMELITTHSGTQTQAHCSMLGSQGKSGHFIAGPDLADGKWHTITCAKTDTGVTLTVDGTQVGSVTATIGSIGNSKKLTLGSNPGGGDWFNGTMDEVSVSIG